MFFENSPLISQSATPAPESVLLMRASYVTPDANDLKQTLAADNTPETILFNDVPLASPDIDVDLVTGESTALKDFSGMVSINALVLRESSPFAASDWGMFAEVFDGSNWVPVSGSHRPLTLAFNSIMKNARMTSLFPFLCLLATSSVGVTIQRMQAAKCHWFHLVRRMGCPLQRV